MLVPEDIITDVSVVNLRPLGERIGKPARDCTSRKGRIVSETADHRFSEWVARLIVDDPRHVRQASLRVLKGRNLTKAVR